MTSAPVARADRTRAWRSRLAAVAVGTVLTAGAVLQTPTAAADAAADLKSAVGQMRTGTSCGQLRPNPVVDDVAYRINKSTQDYLNQVADQVPVTDPLPGLKILGYPGTKAALLQGASKTSGNAIKGLLLQGYKAFPDCAYTDVGTSVIYNDGNGYFLTVAVLAGP